MQMEQKRRKPNYDSMSFIDDDKEDPIEKDSDEDILYQMYVLYCSKNVCYIYKIWSHIDTYI